MNKRFRPDVLNITRPNINNVTFGGCLKCIFLEALTIPDSKPFQTNIQKYYIKHSLHTDSLFENETRLFSETEVKCSEMLMFNFGEISTL